MIRNMTGDYALLQSGYWSAEFDLARPRMTRLLADAGGTGEYCQDLLDPACGGETMAESEGGALSSRDSVGHVARALDDRVLEIRGIRIGDFAVVDWAIRLAGDKGDILRIEVRREITREITLTTEAPFGLQCLREFAFWSRPSLRFGHDPAKDRFFQYAPGEQKAARRVIGYHAASELERFVVHGSPSYPDIELRLASGHYHLEQRYCRQAVFGVSSRDFGGGPVRMSPGVETWVLDLRAIPQGALAPVSFRCGHELLNRFVPEFFDGYLLSAIACDHQYFGNNPYRHAYAPFCLFFMTGGYLATDRRCWSDHQGDMDEAWTRHIRRTLAEGRLRPDRPFILLDSGVWQDQCGTCTTEHGSAPAKAGFVTGCCYHLLKTGDRPFAAEIYGDLEAMLESVAALDPDADGLLENPIPGTPGSPSSGYNDNLSVGHKDGYLNALAHESFRQFAGLARWLGREDVARRYERLAAGIAEAYNRQLWDEQTGHYLGWIDVEGRAHDYWLTYVNFPAIATGIPSPERTRRILAEFVKHPNCHRIFAAGINLDPVGDEYVAQGADRQFGLWLNGGVLLGPAAYELFARAVGLGGEGAWVMLRDLLAQWQQDRLCGTPRFMDWCRRNPPPYEPRMIYTGKNAFTWIDGQGATGAGTEPYLSDGGYLLWALYTGVLGIRPDFQGIRFVPHIPQAMGDTEVGLRLMGRRLTVRTRGHGDALKCLAINGRKVSGDWLAWEDIHPESQIELAVSPSDQ